MSVSTSKPEPPPVVGEKAVAPALFQYLVSYCLPGTQAGTIHPWLRDRLAERVEIGREKYGTVLMTFNGRNALVDAWQEAADLVFYLFQSYMEGEDVEEVLHDAIDILAEVSWLILEKQA